MRIESRILGVEDCCSIEEHWSLQQQQIAFFLRKRKKLSKKQGTLVTGFWGFSGGARAKAGNGWRIPVAFELQTLCMVGMAMKEEEKRKKRVLPINQYEGPILDAIANNTVVVIIGDTGSGKTTQLSQILYRAGYTANGIVAVTQPRRVAAVSVARYAQGTIQRHSDSPSYLSPLSSSYIFYLPKHQTRQYLWGVSRSENH